MRIGTVPAPSSNVTVFASPISPSSPAVARTNAVPTFGWPAKGISLAGVKILTRLVCPDVDGKTKVLSAKLNSRAICCIWAAVSPSASGSTAS